MSILNSIKSVIVSNQKAVKIGGIVLGGAIAVCAGWLVVKEYKASKKNAELLAVAAQRAVSSKVLNRLAKAYRVDSEVSPTLVDFKVWLDTQPEDDLMDILGSHFTAYLGMKDKIFVNEGRLCFTFDGETVSIKL